jgi:hypothetical protein
MKKVFLFVFTAFIFVDCASPEKEIVVNLPSFKLIPAEKFHFKSFVDCNMAEVWIGDTFRIFPGKYGEDPLWGYSEELEFADGRNAIEAFKRNAEEFTDPIMPKNAAPGTPGLHGAVWFETVYQDPRDSTGKLCMLYIITRITPQPCLTTALQKKVIKILIGLRVLPAQLPPLQFAGSVS